MLPGFCGDIKALLAKGWQLLASVSLVLGP
jgi:hypothetical protein